MDRVSEFRRFNDDIVGTDSDTVREKTTEELFADFYLERCGSEPDELDLALLHQAGELLRNSHPNPKQRTAVDTETVSSLLRYLKEQEVTE